MQTNDIVKVSTSKEWALIDPFGEGRKRHETDLTDVEPRRIKYATRLSDKRYQLKTRYNRPYSEDINDFVETEGRVYGFLVKIAQPNGSVYYTVAKPVNFVATRAEYDLHWDAEKARRAEQARIQQEQAEVASRRAEIRRGIRAEREAQAKPEADRVAESIAETIGVLLGNRARVSSSIRVSFDGEWIDEDSDNPQYNLRQTGTVTLNMDDFQRLLEKAMQE